MGIGSSTPIDTTDFISKNEFQKMKYAKSSDINTKLAGYALTNDVVLTFADYTKTEDIIKTYATKTYVTEQLNKAGSSYNPIIKQYNGNNGTVSGNDYCNGEWEKGEGVLGGKNELCLGGYRFGGDNPGPILCTTKHSDNPPDYPAYVKPTAENKIVYKYYCMDTSKETN